MLFRFWLLYFLIIPEKQLVCVYVRMLLIKVGFLSLQQRAIKGLRGVDGSLLTKLFFFVHVAAGGGRKQKQFLKKNV
jgi:hypothetical protein